MKKILLLLVIGLLGVTAVTAQDYDEKFKIQVNGTEEWSPYPGKSGVDFEVINNKAIAVRQNGASVSFTGKQVGNSTIIAKCDGEVKRARVLVRAMKGNVPVVEYNPPAEFYIKERMVESGDVEIYCRIGQNAAYKTLSDDGQVQLHGYVDGEKMKTCDYEPADGKWYAKDISADDDAQLVAEALEHDQTELLNTFFRWLKLTYQEQKRFYKRTEEFLGRDCAVFTLPTPSTMATVWVDIATGCTLKTINESGKVLQEVLEFKTDNLTWDSGLRPSSWDVVAFP